jgi:hypothetical protein
MEMMAPVPLVMPETTEALGKTGVHFCLYPVVVLVVPVVVVVAVLVVVAARVAVAARVVVVVALLPVKMVVLVVLVVPVVLVVVQLRSWPTVALQQEQHI